MNIEQAREVSKRLHLGVSIANDRGINKDFVVIAKAAANAIDALIAEVDQYKVDFEEQMRDNAALRAELASIKGQEPVGTVFAYQPQKTILVKVIGALSPTLGANLYLAAGAQPLPTDAGDGVRYRRLRVLGCAPMLSENLEQGTVLRFTNLDSFVDADLTNYPERGDKPFNTLESASEIALRNIACSLGVGGHNAPVVDAREYEKKILEEVASIAAGAQDAELQKQLQEAEDSRDWYKRRCNELQACQSSMRDPERTMVCDILANGSLLMDGSGKLAADRYAAPAQAQERKPLTDEQIKNAIDSADQQDYSNSEFGDPWSIVFARAVEAAHGIKEKL
ncbi:MAG: hypothetical protein WC829_09900 [Hyphomicrobium sp.]|jgi:hypothetical protein